MVKTSSNGTMVKRGGTKRKIPIKRIENKKSRAVTFSKRTKGLFSKAAQLCHLSPGSQIAILVGPLSSKSNVSFHSFGHSSVDAVLSAFLSGQPLAAPVVETIMREDVKVRRDLGLRFWWDEKMPDTPQDLREAINSVSKLITDLHAYRAEKLIREHHQRNNDQGTHDLDQTLNLPQTETEMVVLDDDDFDHDDAPAATFNNTDQSYDDYIDMETLERLISNNDDTSALVNNNNNNDFEKPADGCSCSNNHYNDFIDRETFNRIMSNGDNNNIEEQNQIQAGNLDGCSHNQEMDDDFETYLENMLSNEDDLSATMNNDNNNSEEHDQIHYEDVTDSDLFVEDEDFFSSFNDDNVNLYDGFNEDLPLLHCE